MHTLYAVLESGSSLPRACGLTTKERRLWERAVRLARVPAIAWKCPKMLWRGESVTEF